MAGDAAGVLDPFSGQGQAAALASGVLAGDTASEFLDGRLAGSDYARVYERAWRLRFRRGFAWGAAMRTLMLAPRLGRIAAAVAGGPLVRLGIRKLAV